MGGEEGGGFSPKAAYIFRKQLEEADAIVLNRIDELDAVPLEELTDLVRAAFSGTPLLRLSATTGQGFEALTELLVQQGNFGRKILDIDYDVYAEGEAELGWLNSSILVATDKPLSVDAFLLDFLHRLQNVLSQLDGEVAHLKAIALTAASFGVANLVSSTSRIELSMPSRCEAKEFDLIVNARVALDPERIAEQVQRMVTACCSDHGAVPQFRTTQSFRPGRPQPTHRYATAQ